MFIPKQNSHKGDNGKILIIAGSKKYSGAAMFSLKAAIPFVDLVYFYNPDKDPYLIQAVKTNIPEVIIVDKIKENVDAYLIGPGLDKNFIDLEQLKNKKRVIDADAFKLGFYYDKLSLLTPNKHEFEELFYMEPNKENVMFAAKKFNTNILLKGETDFLTNGNEIYENIMGNAGLTKGGTGDVLAGFLTALIAKNDVFEAAKFGIDVFSKTADQLFKDKYFYYTPSEIIQLLPYMVKQMIEFK